MIAVWWILALVVLQRLCELAYAVRNTKRLLADGARESGAIHYPLFIVLHAAWLVTIATVAWRTPSVHVNWWLIGVFAVLQCARLWVLATLGPRWTTRIITVPNASLVTSGPYRFTRHPNYAIVALEIAILPLAFGQYAVAIVFTILNGALLSFRIRAEERALSNNA